MELSNYIASAYAEMRQDEIDAGEKAMVYIHVFSSSLHLQIIQLEFNHMQGYTTARTLLSILRLSEALARLRWADQVCGKWICLP